MVYTITGEHDKAFDLLKQILAMPVAISITPEILQLDPVWDPIRDAPRFDKLIEKYSEAPNRLDALNFDARCAGKKWAETGNVHTIIV